MEYVIDLLKRNKKTIERHIKKDDLMQSNMPIAKYKLRKVSELKRAIKILKRKK